MAKKIDFHFLFSHPAHFIALGFGSGLSPKAPGTVGTLLGFPLFLLITSFYPASIIPILIIGFLIGIWACGKTGFDLGVADHGGMVWDEVIAFAIVLLYTPTTGLWYLIAFGLFRLFDIWKPFPIRYFDRKVKGGFGVMLDDLLAAIYAIVVIQLSIFLKTLL